MSFRDWGRTSELKTAPDVKEKRRGSAKANHSLIPVFERRRMFEEVDSSEKSNGSKRGRLSTRKDVSRSSSFRSAKRIKTDDSSPVLKNKNVSSSGLNTSPPWQRLRNFGHYDTQSMSFERLQSDTTAAIATKKATGASAAAHEDCDKSLGENTSNLLIAACPTFKNEIGGDSDWLAETRANLIFQIHLSHDKQKRFGSRQKLVVDGDIPLKELVQSRGPMSRQVHEVLQTQRGIHYPFEFLDYGASFYRNYFLGQEHQNFFGVDENLGPIAISLKRERVPEEMCDFLGIQPAPNQNIPKHQYRVILRTSQLTTLRGTILEESIPSSAKTGTSRGIPPKDVVDYITQGELQPSCLKLGKNEKKVFSELVRLDEQELNNRYKIGVIYCKPGQTTEEEMYNNERGSPAFDEFLTLLGDRVKMRGFSKYRAQLDNKTDTTGEFSVYTEFRDAEIMFHVSTLLPYTASNKQQLLRKRHIGNDIVTIIFQEPGCDAFSAKCIRSHFQHIFIVVRVEDPNTAFTKYKLAVSRSQDIPYFGPTIPEDASFDKNDMFREFVLAKLINACNASLRSEKFSKMAVRTRKQYLSDLAECTTQVTLEQASSGRVVGLLRNLSHRKRERVRQDGTLLFTPGGLTWNVNILLRSGKPLPFSEDHDFSLECVLGMGPDILVFLEADTQEMLLHIPMMDISGWIQEGSRINLFYDNSHCVSLECNDNEEDCSEICTRLHSIAPRLSTSHEASLMEFPRSSNGKLGFGINEAGVVQKVDGLAKSVGLQTNSSLLQVEDRLVCCHSHEEIMEVLTDIYRPSVRAYVVPPPPKGRLAMFYPDLQWKEIWNARPSHMDSEERSQNGNGTMNGGASTPEPMPTEPVTFRQHRRMRSNPNRTSYMEAMRSGEHDDIERLIDDSEPIYDRLINRETVLRPKSPIRSRSPSLGARLKHGDNSMGYTRVKRSMKATRESVVQFADQLMEKNHGNTLPEPEPMEYRVEEYSPGVRARVSSSTKISDHKSHTAAPLSQRRLPTSNQKRPVIEVTNPYSPGQVNELTKRFSFTPTSPGTTGNKHLSKIPVNSNVPLKATASTSEMTKSSIPVRAVSSNNRPTQIPNHNGVEGEVKLRNRSSYKARPASWDVSTLLDSKENDMFVTKDDSTPLSKADIEAESFHRNSNIRSAFRRSKSREFSPEPMESSPEASPSQQRRTAPPQSPPANRDPTDELADLQKLSQGSHSSQGSQGSGPPMSVRERTKKWESRGGGVPSYFTLPKSFRHKATDKRKDSLSSIPTPTSTKPPMQRRSTAHTTTPTSTGERNRHLGSGIPQPSSKIRSPRTSVTTPTESTRSLGRRVSNSREEADGSSNPDETVEGRIRSSRQPVIKTKNLTVSVSKTRGDSLLPTKTVISSSPTSRASTSSQPSKESMEIPQDVEGGYHSHNHHQSNASTHNGIGQQNGLESSDVHSELQSLSLSDKSGPVPNGRTRCEPRVEEWIRQTSQTALPLDSDGLEPPRDIASPTFTDNSLNYSQISDVSQDREMIESLKSRIEFLEGKLEKETESKLELREKLKSIEDHLFCLQSKKRVKSIKTAMI